MGCASLDLYHLRASLSRGGAACFRFCLFGRQTGSNPHEREVATSDFGPAGGPESGVLGDRSCLVGTGLPTAPPGRSAAFGSQKPPYREVLDSQRDGVGGNVAVECRLTRAYRWIFPAAATLWLNSADLFLGTVRDFHCSPRKCLASMTICPMWRSEERRVGKECRSPRA